MIRNRFQVCACNVDSFFQFVYEFSFDHFIHVEFSYCDMFAVKSLIVHENEILYAHDRNSRSKYNRVHDRKALIFNDEFVVFQKRNDVNIFDENCRQSFEFYHQNILIFEIQFSIFIEFRSVNNFDFRKQSFIYEFYVKDSNVALIIRYHQLNNVRTSIHDSVEKLMTNINVIYTNLSRLKSFQFNVVETQNAKQVRFKNAAYYNFDVKINHSRKNVNQIKMKIEKNNNRQKYIRKLRKNNARANFLKSNTIFSEITVTSDQSVDKISRVVDTSSMTTLCKNCVSKLREIYRAENKTKTQFNQITWKQKRKLLSDKINWEIFTFHFLLINYNEKLNKWSNVYNVVWFYMINSSLHK